MKKLVIDADINMKEEVAEGSILDILQFACADFFPAIKNAGSKRCALSIGRLLLSIFRKR